MSTDEYVPSEDEVRGRYCDGTYMQTGHTSEGDDFDAWLAGVRRDAAREALDRLEADTAQVIRTMRERGEQGWARYAIANDILDSHRTRFYPEETP